MKLFTRVSLLLPLLLICQTPFVKCAEESSCEGQGLNLANCFIQTGAQCAACFGNATTALVLAAAAGGGDECSAYNAWICPSNSCCTDGCQTEFNEYMQCVIDETTAQPCTLTCTNEGGGDPAAPVTAPQPTPTPTSSPANSKETPAPTTDPLAFTFAPTDEVLNNNDDPCKAEEEDWEACLMRQGNAASCAACSQQDIVNPSLADILSGDYCQAWRGWTCPLVNCCAACTTRLEALFQCEISNDPLTENCDLDCANYVGGDDVDNGSNSGGDDGDDGNNPNSGGVVPTNHWCGAVLLFLAFVVTSTFRW